MKLNNLFIRYEKFRKELVYLLINSYNIDKVDIALHSDITIADELVKRISDDMKQVEKKRPLQYIVGHTSFMGYDICVNEGVLIPRPETELLCSLTLKYIRPEMKILDLCTGSGAIIIAISKEISVKAYASDISLEALEIAKLNAKLNDANIDFIHSDLFDNINGKFDIIVSNPPYIPTKDLSELDSVVKDNEPIIALDGGNDGLDYYRRIAKEAKLCLSDNGKLLLEIGYNQAVVLENILLENGYENIKSYKDYNGFDRMISASLRRRNV